jgi:hypothetical protein
MDSMDGLHKLLELSSFTLALTGFFLLVVLSAFLGAYLIGTAMIFVSGNTRLFLLE